MEALEIKHDVLEAIGRKSREHKYWLTLPIDRKKYPEESPRAKVLAAAGWVIIVLGVTGEGVFEGFVSKYDTALSKMTDTIVAEAEKESAHAEAIAKGFDAKIAESTARVQAAEAIISTADARIAEAQRDAAESKKEAESERLARVQLQKELEPRRLTGAQKEKLRALLSDDPQQIMFAWCQTGTDDCQDFVNDIGEAFNKAKWTTWFGASLRNKRGIEVGFTKGSDEQLAAHWVPKIRHALSEVGLTSEQEWFDPNDKWSVGGFQKNGLYVIVGQKPAITSKTAKADRQ
ncbi:MAG: hypothetical protein ABSG07_10055 [Terriglobales bacterium]|jgi:hypothetical protein